MSDIATRTAPLQPDYMFNKSASEWLAGRVKAFWNKRGKYPQVWVEAEHRGNGSIFVVRSDMLGARPI